MNGTKHVANVYHAHKNKMHVRILMDILHSGTPTSAFVNASLGQNARDQLLTIVFVTVIELVIGIC